MLALAVVVSYMLVLVGVGVVKSRQVHDQAGFALAGRKLGPWVLVGTLLATWTGTGSIFGNAEQAYQVGLPALILPVSAALGILVLVVMIPGVRRRGRYTLQDILEDRFGPVARVLATLTLVIAYLVIISYQIRAASAVLERVLAEAGLVDGGDPELMHSASMATVAILIGVYTALAGLMSVAFTDSINGVLMLVGLCLALPLVWSAAGGVEGVLTALPAAGRQVTGHYSGFDIASILLPSFLLVVGDANLHQRFLAAPSTSVARRAAWMLIPGVLIVDAVIILTAVAGRALLPELDSPGEVILELAMTQLPTALGALLVAAILAIIVSTADSFLLSSASSLAHDGYRRFVRPDASGVELLRVSRIMVLALTLVALLMAFQSAEFFSVALFAYTIYGVGITPPLLAALFWRRATPAGAVASMLTATGFAIWWELNDRSSWAVEMLDLPEGSSVGAVVPAIVVACVALVGISLVTRPRPEADPA
jgi:SSS family transporter